MGTGSLIPKGEFIGLENVTHLAAGGETPVLISNAAAVTRFMVDKGVGMPGRDRMFATATGKGEPGQTPQRNIAGDCAAVERNCRPSRSRSWNGLGSSRQRRGRCK